MLCFSVGVVVDFLCENRITLNFWCWKNQIRFRFGGLSLYRLYHVHVIRCVLYSLSDVFFIHIWFVCIFTGCVVDTIASMIMRYIQCGKWKTTEQLFFYFSSRICGISVILLKLIVTPISRTLKQIVVMIVICNVCRLYVFPYSFYLHSV